MVKFVFVELIVNVHVVVTLPTVVLVLSHLRVGLSRVVVTNTCVLIDVRLPVKDVVNLSLRSVIACRCHQIRGMLALRESSLKVGPCVF